MFEPGAVCPYTAAPNFSKDALDAPLLAEITLTLKDTASAKATATAHYTVPMETENLIIVREPLASQRVGPYHIQRVKNFAVIERNSAPDSPDYFTGLYRKQPAQP